MKDGGRGRKAGILPRSRARSFCNPHLKAPATSSAPLLLLPSLELRLYQFLLHCIYPRLLLQPKSLRPCWRSAVAIVGRMARSPPSSSLSHSPLHLGHLNGSGLMEMSEHGIKAGFGQGERGVSVDGIEGYPSGSECSTPQGGGGGVCSLDSAAPAWRDPFHALVGRSTPFNPIWSTGPTRPSSANNGEGFVQLSQDGDGSCLPSARAPIATSTRSSWDSKSSGQNGSHSGRDSNSSSSDSSHQSSVGHQVSFCPSLGPVPLVVMLLPARHMY